MYCVTCGAELPSQATSCPSCLPAPSPQRRILRWVVIAGVMFSCWGGSCAVLVWARDKLSEAEAAGLVMEDLSPPFPGWMQPPPFAGRGGCDSNIQDFTCSTMLLYRAPEAHAMLAHNGYWLREPEPALAHPTPAVPSWHGKSVRTLSIEGLASTREGHRMIDRTGSWNELEDGSVVLTFFTMSGPTQ